MFDGYRPWSAANGCVRRLCNGRVRRPKKSRVRPLRTMFGGYECSAAKDHVRWLFTVFGGYVKTMFGGPKRRVWQLRAGSVANDGVERLRITFGG